MKKSIFLFFAAILCASSVNAAYFYRGNQNSWGATEMITSSDGFYSYYKAKSYKDNGNQNNNFKVATSTGRWDYNADYLKSGFNGTNVTNMGKWDGDNCGIYHTTTYYVLIYHPNSAINQTDKPIICASTTLPDSRNHGFEQDNNGIKFYHGSDTEWKFNGQIAQTKNLKTINQLYLKEWFVQLYENWDGAKGNVKMQYNIHLANNTPGNYTDIEKNWTDGQGTWNNYYSYPKYGNNFFNINLLEGLGSGKYTMSFKYYDKDLNITSPIHKLNWTIAVPDITSAECTSNGTGLGTETSPFTVPEGDILTLTVKGTQESDDANSELYAQFASNEYSSTLTHNITPTTTVQSITIKVKYYNSADELSSNEQTLTIYYKAIQEETHDVTISYKCNGNKIDNVDDKILKIGVSTATAVTAPSITNYTFSSWTLGSGVYSDDAKTANPISVITLSEGNYVMTANYTKIELTYTVKVPEGTENCYIAGDMNSWSFQEMTPTANANEFTITIDGATKDHKYKYVCGTDWKYVEVKANGENSDDRNYNATDVVERWNCAPGIHLVGEMTNWNTAAHKFQKASEEATTASVTLNLESGDYQFKVNNDGEWLGNNSEMKRGGTSVHEGGWTFESDKNPCVLKADIAGSYTFTWDITNKKLTVTYPELPKYTVTTFATEGGSVTEGSTYTQDTKITLTATANEGYEFVNWKDEETVVSTEASYTFTVTKDVNLTATFQLKSYEVSATATNGTVTGAGTYDHGTSVTLTATPNFDYNFVNWTVGNEVVSTDNPYTFQATADVVVVANFQEVAATDQTLSGQFSTGKYEYAEFATGNLQYNTGTDKWRFAKQQYQVVGEQNINVGDPDFKGWIDMFGWSTNDTDNNFGVNPSMATNFYTGDFNDWGIKIGEGWLTLSHDQWYYLLNERANASSLKQVAYVGTVFGIMLFPDKWTYPDGCKVEKTLNHDDADGTDYDFYSYNYTLDQWAKLEAAGAVFLPAAGRRFGGYGNTYNSNGENTGSTIQVQHSTNGLACYWTSSKHTTDGNKVSSLFNLLSIGGDKYKYGILNLGWYGYGNIGQSVRLAKVTNTLIEIGGDNNSSVIEANKDKIVNVQVNRTFTAGVGYYTLCLPFALDADKIGKAYELETITEYKANGGININLTEVDNIEAGKPYLVLPSEDLTNPIFEKVTIVNTTGETIEPASVAGVKVTFTGIINGVGEETNGTTEYYVGNNGYLYKGTVAKLGLRAFFTITDETGNPTQIRARVVAGEDVETGVENIITTDDPVKVIENGQLIIIRGGVKYNVQGQKL